MFHLIIDDQNIDYSLNTAADVANAVFDSTGIWSLASVVKQWCCEAKPGTRLAFEDTGVIIYCH